MQLILDRVSCIFFAHDADVLFSNSPNTVERYLLLKKYIED